VYKLRTEKSHSGEFLASTGRCGACKSTLPPVAEPIAADEALFDEIIQKFTGAGPRGFLGGVVRAVP